MIYIDIYKSLKSNENKIEMEFQFEISKGDFIAIYGPSGSGKTSLLRMIAGLTPPNIGQITHNDSIWFSSKQKINLEPQKRKVGFVFQDFALFPHMNVIQNLQFALQKNENKSILDEILEIIELTDLTKLKPHQLSGGQKQRVALARAIVSKPSLLLLDEPLSSLDENIRFKLQDYLSEIHNHFKLTTLLVSHDKNEIKKLSNKLIEINKGKINKIGTPQEIFKNTQTDTTTIYIPVEIINKKHINEIESEITVLINGKSIVKKIPPIELVKFQIGTKTIMRINLSDLIFN